MGAVDDHDAAASLEGRRLRIAREVAHLGDLERRAVRRIDADVEVLARGRPMAGAARVARVAVDRRLAREGLRQLERERALADPLGTGEEQRMRETVAPDRAQQGVADVGVADRRG
jgi:hypothetical protein